ncbi:MAG TPA: GNAT family N-acetyltransferase [Candidatus Krumholzibacteria bacterium]|nr:GNAT family N-acetyltransferase [Candidatus Krumholzibacteria bacterium]
MTTESRVIRATTPRDWEQARVLIEEYAAGLGVDLCFQNFDEEIEHLATHYGPPRGALLLAFDGEKAVGCVGLREHDATTGEVKRLYVAPTARGRDLGRALASAIVETGRERGYSRLVLDTLPSMQAAQALYVSLGFRTIEAYRYNPVQGTVFMELNLR